MIYTSEKPKFYSTKEEFRNWLDKNHDKESVLWVGYYKKKTAIPSITWPESVDEALCFGWIDGLRKSIDEKSYKIRFTPRKANSHWNKKNLERYVELENKGLITKPGKEVFEGRNKKNERRASYEQKEVSLTKDYLQILKANKNAYEYYQSLSPYMKRASNWYVMSAKRAETRKKRLQLLIDSCASHKKLPQFDISKKEK